MEQSRKTKIWMSVFFVIFLFSFSVVYLFLDKKTGGETLGVKEEEVEEIVEPTAIPKILSLAPMTVVGGEFYEYLPRVMDNDSDEEELVLDLVQAPDWLSLTSDGVVSGFVPMESIGESFSFVLRVSDGYNSSSQENFVLVVDSNEKEDI